ncbi:MAG: hypothetical protein RIE59_15325 [Imperialibacter sp.]
MQQVVLATFLPFPAKMMTKRGSEFSFARQSMDDWLYSKQQRLTSPIGAAHHRRGLKPTPTNAAGSFGGIFALSSKNDDKTVPTYSPKKNHIFGKSFCR